MPCFNAASFVEHAVRSALDQTYENVELIVVDDGSTDGSRVLLARLEREYSSRMTVLHQERQGPYPARNLGIERASGGLVAFLDADDYWAPDCLAKLKSALDGVNADLAYCGWQNVGENAPGHAAYVPPEYESRDTVAQFLKACPWPIHAALLRRSMVDRVRGFSTRMFSAMDYDLWLRIIALSPLIVRVPEVLAFYRWHEEGQISAIKWRQVLDAWQVRHDFANANPALISHIEPGVRRELLDGCLLTAGYAAFWKRELLSAHRLFRKAALRGFWRLRDAKYVLPSLLPLAAYSKLIAFADHRTGESN